MSTFDSSFQRLLKMSRGIAQGALPRHILLNNVPGAVAVRVSTHTEDRNGIDLWVDRKNGRSISVDVKDRLEDYTVKPWPFTADDLALEMWSNVERGHIGWTRDPMKQCDLILWVWRDTGRWCKVYFPHLCAVFIENYDLWTTRRGYRIKQQNTDNLYHSQCVFVPREVVEKAIQSRFWGDKQSKRYQSLFEFDAQVEEPPIPPEAL